VDINSADMTTLIVYKQELLRIQMLNLSLDPCVAVFMESRISDIEDPTPKPQ